MKLREEQKLKDGRANWECDDKSDITSGVNKELIILESGTKDDPLKDSYFSFLDGLDLDEINGWNNDGSEPARGNNVGLVLSNEGESIMNMLVRDTEAPPTSGTMKLREN